MCEELHAQDRQPGHTAWLILKWDIQLWLRHRSHHTYAAQEHTRPGQAHAQVRLHSIELHWERKNQTVGPVRQLIRVPAGPGEYPRRILEIERQNHQADRRVGWPGAEVHLAAEEVAQAARIPHGVQQGVAQQLHPANNHVLHHDEAAINPMAGQEGRIRHGGLGQEYRVDG